MTDLPEPADVAALADLGRRAAGPNVEPVNPDEHRLLLVREQTYNDGNRGDYPSGFAERVRVLSLEPWATRPARRRGTVTFDEGGSFSLYVNEFTPDGQHPARLYASLSERRAVAVLNDDVPGWDAPAGAWRDHRAVLRVLTTPEWDRWRKGDSEMGSQEDFAEHLELNLADIVEPAAADLVEIARSFTASSDIQFRSAVNLATGETRFAYDEDTRAAATSTGGQSIDIPRTFTLRIAPFQGMDPIEVIARLRYKLRGAHLSIGYLLMNPDDVERSAFKDTIEQVAGATGLPAHYASAPEPRTVQANGHGDTIL